MHKTVKIQFKKVKLTKNLFYNRRKGGFFMAKTTHISFLPLNRCMENQTVNLAVSDLIMLHSLIQLACERGAFRAEEMSQIGQCYDRLTVWLAQMQVPPETPQPEQPQGE